MSNRQHSSRSFLCHWDTAQQNQERCRPTADRCCLVPAKRSILTSSTCFWVNLSESWLLLGWVELAGGRWGWGSGLLDLENNLRKKKGIGDDMAFLWGRARADSWNLLSWDRGYLGNARFGSPRAKEFPRIGTVFQAKNSDPGYTPWSWSSRHAFQGPAKTKYSKLWL